MGILELLYEEDLHYQEMSSYLDFEEGYWKKHDIWYGSDTAFQKVEIKSEVGNWTIADFTSFQNNCLKTEMKYYVLSSLKNGRMTVAGFTKNYLRAIRLLGEIMSQQSIETFRDVCIEALDLSTYGLTKTEIGAYKRLKSNVVYCIRDLYDERPELERDIWHARVISGVKLSAAIKREKPSMSFEKIPDCYKESVKRYMKSLIYRRSWSFCTELLVSKNFVAWRESILVSILSVFKTGC